MATPRKEQAKGALGPRVNGQRAGGRPITGNEFARALVDRVKAIRKRLVAVQSDPRSPSGRMTRLAFAERIGLTDDTLRLRLRKSKPILFSAQELAAICREFGVRAEYMLTGEEPMFHADLIDDLVEAVAEAGQAVGGAGKAGDKLLLEHFPATLHRYLTTLLATAREQERSWIAAHLPSADDLARAVEQGVADALTATVDRQISHRLLANDCVREAVANRADQAAPSVDVPNGFFTSATAGLANGTVIDLKGPPRRRQR